ncbi:hypothetical protein AAZX31_08G224700 [Glycine max]|nr:hypothetical protein JHK87_022066 [Glycine soja]KAG5016485.1 hypothetical protein JHK85_022621 [Glycine max]KAG5026254.1 hypothetical protein JHK86_022168 [Glycine max]KAG5137409.1 hypothetical protein JHK82_022140 [Glycine max]
MNAIIPVLIVLLVLTNGIENEGPLKMIEARSCKDIIFVDWGCEDNTCNTDCRQKHGRLASGLCNETENCLCHFPC